MARKHIPKKIKMPKGKQKEENILKRQKNPPLSLQKSLLQTIQTCFYSSWTKIVAISVLITIISFGFLIYPRISINPGIAMGITTNDPNPFIIPFILINNGYLSITDITINYSIRSLIRLTNPKIDIAKYIKISDTDKLTETKIAKLSPGKSASIEFKVIMVDSSAFLYKDTHPELFFSSAIIDINSTFKPYPMPFHMSYSQSFKTIRSSNNRLIWIPIEDK